MNKHVIYEYTKTELEPEYLKIQKHMWNKNGQTVRKKLFFSFLNCFAAIIKFNVVNIVIIIRKYKGSSSSTKRGQRKFARHMNHSYKSSVVISYSNYIGFIFFFSSVSTNFMFLFPLKNGYYFFSYTLNYFLLAKICYLCSSANKKKQTIGK